MEIDFMDREGFCIIGLLCGGKAYLREIAEKTGLAVSTVHKKISALEKKSIIRSSRNKNRKIFELNYDSALARSLLTALVIHDLTATKEFRLLAKLKTRGIYLFGSSAQGRMTVDSDIDLAAYFDKKPGQEILSKIKRGMSNRLGREIQLITLSDEKLKSMKEENVELFNQIKHKSIILSGEAIE